jgi:hypothetical protein
MFASTQAIVVLIVYVLGIIATLVTSIVKHGFTAWTAIGMLFSILFMALTVYDTHCLTAGNCTVWSWIRTGLYILIPVISLIVWMFSFGNKDGDKDSKRKMKKKTDDEDA